jgi:hypothetical protein
MDGRLQTILAFAATTSAIVPTVANARGLAFRSWWLYLALVLFALILAVGSYARLCGTIRLLKPEIIYDRWLHKGPLQFKKDFVYFAAQDFNENAALVKKKWRLSVAISCLFFIEVACLVVWVAARA